MAFAIKDCALAAIATGVRAHNLRELRDQLMTVHPGSIYYHFWGELLRPAFDLREYNNDFANWARSAHGLHDEALAERLSVIDPTDFDDLEDLRQQVVEVTSDRLEESEKLRLLHADRPFMFIRSQIVIFDTGRDHRTPVPAGRRRAADDPVVDFFSISWTRAKGRKTAWTTSANG